MTAVAHTDHTIDQQQSSMPKQSPPNINSKREKPHVFIQVKNFTQPKTFRSYRKTAATETSQTNRRRSQKKKKKEEQRAALWATCIGTRWFCFDNTQRSWLVVSFLLFHFKHQTSFECQSINRFSKHFLLLLLLFSHCPPPVPPATHKPSAHKKKQPHSKMCTWKIKALPRHGTGTRPKKPSRTGQCQTIRNTHWLIWSERLSRRRVMWRGRVERENG